MARAIKTVLKHLNDSRGVSLYEITAAVAMTGILAAVAVPVVLDRVEESRVARSVLETDAISKAIEAFKKDTGRHPGELEGISVLVSASDSGFLTDGVLPFTGSSNSKTAVATRTACQDPTPPGATPGQTVTCGNLNTFLTATQSVFNAHTGNKYTNYRGPYMDKIEKDQFDRVYSIYVKPMYDSGATGFGWVFSAGPDRDLDTPVTEQKLVSASDDLGKNLGKKVVILQQ